jgi:glycosyltransferase involved in cell wall biosynthesis
MAALGRHIVRFLEQADAVCTPTATAAALLRALGLTRPIEVISNGIDTARFTPDADKAAARADLGLADRPTVLYTGRLDPEKEMPTWIRAAARALREVDAQLVIGGEGTQRAALENQVRLLGIESRVTFPGYLPFWRLPRLYQAADVYFMASTVELQSISTLEALASGLPVVAADAGALPELVHNRDNGYLVAPGDEEAFAEALCMLLSQPALARSMGEAGRRRAEAHALGTVARRHVDLLEVTARGRVDSAKAGTA